MGDHEIIEIIEIIYPKKWWISWVFSHPFLGFSAFSLEVGMGFAGEKMDSVDLRAGDLKESTEAYGTVDVSEIRQTHRLRLVVYYPSIYRVSKHPRWVFGISSINSSYGMLIARSCVSEDGWNMKFEKRPWQP